MFADVIVDIQHEKLDKIFQYRIPERLKDELYPGLEVIIPFGKGNRQIKGYVTSLSETCNYDLSKVKEITDISRNSVAIEARLIALAAAGSEMSSSCVISNPETGEKRGCNGLFNRMNFAIEDPVLTYTVSPYQTACGAVDIAMHTIERYFCPGEDTYLTDSIAEAVIKSVRKAAGDCLKNPEDYAARANMMWASSLAHNGLTQCGREFQLVVHQLEHEVSGMYPEVAHGAGLAALWCSWARYVYKANINRWLQYASNVWGLDIDFEHPEKTIETAIDMQEQYYASIGMPIGLKELGVKEEDLAKLALDCSRNKTRSLIGYKPLAYEDILVIYQMAYERG